MEEDVEVVDLPPGMTQKGYRELGGKATSIIGMIVNCYRGARGISRI